MNQVPPVQAPPVLKPAASNGAPVIVYKFSPYDFVCENCGVIERPRTITRGSIGVEILLWLCFILPGLVYSLWRLSNREHDRCPNCLGHMVPATSPRGLVLARQFHPDRTFIG